VLQETIDVHGETTDGLNNTISAMQFSLGLSQAEFLTQMETSDGEVAALHAQIFQLEKDATEANVIFASERLLLGETVLTVSGQETELYI